MINITHALSPFITCPFKCPFCCAKDNVTNSNVELTSDYWDNLESSINGGQYKNIMLTGDTEPTLFHDWLKRIVELSDKYNLINELRTHNYSFHPSDIHFNQVWYSITDADYLVNLPQLWKHGMQFSDEVNFAILINKDFKVEDIIKVRKLLPESKITIRYLMDECGSDDIAKWIIDNEHTFDIASEELLQSYNIRINKCYLSEYDIIRQDGKIYHEWQ